jgi:hypothetical protein
MRKTIVEKQKATVREIDLAEAEKASGGYSPYSSWTVLPNGTYVYGTSSASYATSCKLPIGGMPGA